MEAAARNSKKEKKPVSSGKENRPLTKVVIRRLPPTMSEATFLEQVQPLPDYDRLYYVQADRTMALNASRAYINFVNMDDVYVFKEKFDGYIFLDAKGSEFPAVVEFAPYQRMGRMRSKLDRKMNTYETNEHFLEFVRTMDTEEVLPKLELKSDFEAKQDKQIRSTPLLEFLNDKKARRRDRDRGKQGQEKKKILAPIKENNSSQGQGKEKVRPSKDAAKAQRKPKAVKTGGVSQEEGPPRKERSEKEKARRAERDKLRREKRQQLLTEKKKEQGTVKIQQKADAPKGDSSQAQAPSAKTSKPKRPERPKDDKRQMERKKENPSKGPGSGRNREERPKANPSAETTTKNNSGASSTAPPAPEGEKKESRRYSERRVRNKDRPPIQIYQPGSRTKKPEE